MNYTPGPWFNTDDCRIIDGEGFLIAELSDEVSDDDARLIAAAPDLLAACQSAMVSLQSFDDSEEIREMLAESIAKAEGR